MTNKIHKEILTLLSSEPLTQSQLAVQLNVSRSRINQSYKTLERLNLVEQQKSFKKIGNPIQLKPKIKYVVVVNLTCWDKSIEIFDWSNIESPLITSLFDFNGTTISLLDEIEKTLLTMLDSAQLDKNKLQSILIVTQGAIEQETGYIYQSNVFPMFQFNLRDAMVHRFNIPTKITNISYCEMLSLIEYSSDPNYLLIGAGRGCVGMGVVLNGEILLGERGFFLGCTHIPYKYDLEGSLGYYNERSLETLLFLLQSIVPMFNIRKVYLSGDTFENNTHIFNQLRLEISKLTDISMQRLDVDFFPDSEKNLRRKAVWLAVNQAIDDIDFINNNTLINYIHRRS